LISGGNFDIHPSYYGEKPIRALGAIKKDRTEFELELVDLALNEDLPLLGICGGAQAINVALGGSLYQDIATQLPNATKHEQGTKRDKGGHPILIHSGTRLRQIIQRQTLKVNTTHHQAVRKVGKGLLVNATAEDGLIEGLELQPSFRPRRAMASETSGARILPSAGSSLLSFLLQSVSIAGSEAEPFQTQRLPSFQPG
jgi:putative glutamine amidotransferase